MKKKDIIQLVKKLVKEDAYGSATLTTQGSPRTGTVVPTDEYPFSARPKRTGTGMMEDESTSFKVVNADTGKTIDFGIDQAKAEEIVAAAKEDNINAKVVKMKNDDDVGKLDEEGASWGLEPRQLADSFTFDELEQLYNDKKISKEDLNGAKSYLQSWIDMHPTYLPQRDLTSPKRQKIRDKYLSEEKLKNQPFPGIGENKELSDNPKLQPGKIVTYQGTRYEVSNNSGYVLTLKSLESGNELKLNLGQLRDRPIKENNMKKNIKEADLYTIVSTDGEEKQVSFPDAGTAAQAASKNANIKMATKLENNDELPVADSVMGAVNDLLNKIEKYENDAHPAVDDNIVDYRKTKQALHMLRLAVDEDEGGAFGGDFNESIPDDEDEEGGWMGADDAKDMMREYIKERGDSNLMEHMDTYRKRATLMEGATEKLFKLFNAGKTDLEVRSHYLQMNVDMPESFIAKLRNNWESLRKTKLDLTLADKEAEGFEAIQQQPAVSGMDGGELDGMEETKTLASGLFTK